MQRRKNIFEFYRIINLNQSLFSAESVLHTYKLAAALFKRSGQIFDYASTLLKILYVIKDIIELNKKSLSNDANYCEILKGFIDIDINTEKDKNKKNNYRGIERIAETIFEATTWNNEVANRPQILKYREVLGIAHDRDLDRDEIYNNLTNISENREAIILVESIKLKLGTYTPEAYLKDFELSRSVVSPYSSINNRYLRILELKYRSERCFFIIKYILGFESILSPVLSEPNIEISKIRENLELVLKAEKEKCITINDIVVFVIKEALFCMQESIKMINLYDPAYFIGYSFIAEAHKRMGDWSIAYENYKSIMFKDEKFDRSYLKRR